MINNVVLTGRLTKKPELKHTQNGIAVTDFNIAVERPFKNSRGEKETDFIRGVAFRGTAETMANYLNKGSLIGIEGRLQARSYEDNDGKTVFITEIVVDNFTFLETKKQAQQNQQNTADNQQNYMQNNRQSAQQGNYNPQNDNPFANADFNDDPFEANDDVTDISDSSLPF